MSERAGVLENTITWFHFVSIIVPIFMTIILATISACYMMVNSLDARTMNMITSSEHKVEKMITASEDKTEKIIEASENRLEKMTGISEKRFESLLAIHTNTRSELGVIQSDIAAIKATLHERWRTPYPGATPRLFGNE